MSLGLQITPLYQSRTQRTLSQEYGFKGQEFFYDQHRPSWDSSFSSYALRKAGITQLPNGRWQGTLTGDAPVVVSMGAGTGQDAAWFKRKGCKVILVEPNPKLLELAKQNMACIPEGEAVFMNTDAMNTAIAPGSVDLIVVAQALHTLKNQYAAQYRTELQKWAGVGTEELARRHWQTLLPSDQRPRVSIWYYNLNPKHPMTHVLHDLLLINCVPYRNSQSQLLNAAFFEPNHFQPWIARHHLEELVAFDLPPVTLKREQVGDWLSSYSFKPAQQDFVRVVRILQEEWFDKFQKDGIVYLPYKGFMAQGPLRNEPYLIEDIEYPIAARSPLFCPVEKIYRPMARL